MGGIGTRALIGLAGLALLVAGCGGPARLYVNPQADLALYRKIAVLPFNNLTGQAFAGERVTRALVTELILSDHFQVVEPAEFRAALDRAGVESGAGSEVYQERLKTAADEVQATGILRGAVTEYEMRRSGQDEVPVVGFDIELLDTATGNVVWRVAIHRKGRGRVLFLGGGARTFGRVTQEACIEAIQALKGKAF